MPVLTLPGANARKANSPARSEKAIPASVSALMRLSWRLASGGRVRSARPWERLRISSASCDARQKHRHGLLVAPNTATIGANASLLKPRCGHTVRAATSDPADVRGECGGHVPDTGRAQAGPCRAAVPPQSSLGNRRCRYAKEEEKSGYNANALLNVHLLDQVFSVFLNPEKLKR